MSTLKTTNIQHPSASEPSITLDSDGGMTGGFPSPNRNLVYNGAMQVHQRGTSVVGITGSGYYTADRWNTPLNGLGIWTQSVENDAPTGSGFSKSLKMLCRTADTAPAAGDLLIISQTLEGQDVQRIAKGTASAQQLTLSFWVKANVTGTYTCELVDSSNGRGVSASYSVSASATWEKKTITLPADTTGAFASNNEASLVVSWWLGAGTTFSSGTLATAWTSLTSANRAVGQTNLAAANNNYWQVTGVQLETGAVATPFEFKSHGQELRECQRYYQKSFRYEDVPAQGVTIGRISTVGAAYDVNNIYTAPIRFPVPMRTPPTVTYYKSSSGSTDSQWAFHDGSNWVSATYTYTDTISESGFTPRPNKSNAFVALNGYAVSGHYTVDAEL